MSDQTPPTPIEIQTRPLSGATSVLLEATRAITQLTERLAASHQLQGQALAELEEDLIRALEGMRVALSVELRAIEDVVTRSLDASSIEARDLRAAVEALTAAVTLLTGRFDSRDAREAEAGEARAARRREAWEVIKRPLTGVLLALAGALTAILSQCGGAGG